MTMRAVTIKKFGGPEELALETVAVPTPKEGEVLIRVQAIGVNPVDTIIRQGWFGPRTFPFILGMDVAGVIEKVGPGVKGYKAGDRVYTFDTVSGGYAEFAVASVTRIGHFDNKLSFAQGAALGVPYHTAWKSLYFRAQAKKEETILIHGASGAVGIAAVQIAKANGHFVIGTAGTKAGLDLVLKEGANLAFNHREDGYIEKIKEATKGKGVDVILEMAASVNLTKDVDLPAKRGRIVVIGSHGPVENFHPQSLMLKEVNVMGVALMTASEEEWTQVKNGVESLLKKGLLKPVIAKEYKLGEAAQAQIDIMSNSGTLGKIVLDATK